MGRKASSLSLWVGVKVFQAHNEFDLVKLCLLPPSSASQFFVQGREGTNKMKERKKEIKKERAK